MQNRDIDDELPDPRREFRPGAGPVLATAVHAGHDLRPGMLGLSALDDATRRREEDPLTDVLASVGDATFVSRVSRFEVDLNRPTEQAVYRVPDDAWGLELWRSPLTDEAVDASLAAHAAFYRLMARQLESMIRTHGKVLLLDVHSYNHRRDGADADPAPADANPEIDLGLTTADTARFGDVVDAFATNLRGAGADGGASDVRENVRFPDGGHWPEWVHEHYGTDVCTITLEYRKSFMDEWTGLADIAVLERLRRDLSRATDAARRALG